jgi:oligoribonuclease (3'-5' exoribonuclease)
MFSEIMICHCVFQRLRFVKHGFFRLIQHSYVRLGRVKHWCEEEDSKVHNLMDRTVESTVRSRKFKQSSGTYLQAWTPDSNFQLPNKDV